MLIAFGGKALQTMLMGYGQHEKQIFSLHLVQLMSSAVMTINMKINKKTADNNVSVLSLAQLLT